MKPGDPTSDSPSGDLRSPALDWVVAEGAVDEVYVRLAKRVRRRQQLTAGAAALVVATAFTLLWAVPWFRDTSTVATLAAHRRTLDLVDGSRAELNARTSMHTDFRSGRRLVRLDQGEAFFSVAKDKEHPFLVETPAGTVRVTGTKFNVRLANDGHAEVTLLEGSVDFQETEDRGQLAASQVSGLRSQVSLSPGEQFDGAAVRSLTPADIESITAWRDGLIVLDGLTLAEAASRLEAYHDRAITVAPAVAGLRPGGSYALDDLAGFLGAMEAALPVRVMREADGSCRIVGKTP